MLAAGDHQRIFVERPRIVKLGLIAPSSMKSRELRGTPEATPTVTAWTLLGRAARPLPAPIRHQRRTRRDQRDA
jgi:hypothetical protein